MKHNILIIVGQPIGHRGADDVHLRQHRNDVVRFEPVEFRRERRVEDAHGYEDLFVLYLSHNAARVAPESPASTLDCRRPLVEPFSTSGG
jgi:hypothetical protein